MPATIEVVLQPQRHVVAEVVLNPKIDLVRICVLEALACRESEWKHRQRDRSSTETSRQELLVRPNAALSRRRIEPLLIRQIIQRCRQSAVEIDKPAQSPSERVRRIEASKAAGVIKRTRSEQQDLRRL